MKSVFGYFLYIKSNWRIRDLSWIIGGSSVYIRLILLTQNSYSLQRLHRDVTSPHFVRSSHLPKSAVSCSFAFNGSSMFCFLDFVQSQKHSSLSSSILAIDLRRKNSEFDKFCWVAPNL